MKLNKILESIDYDNSENIRDITVDSVHLNSNTVTNGGLFLCGHKDYAIACTYITQAINKGAIAIISHHKTFDLASKHIDVIFVEHPNIDSNLDKIFKLFYPQAAKMKHYVAVTGTNGKTTITNWVANLAQRQNVGFGTIGTLGYKINNHHYPAKLTTPTLDENYRILHSMAKESLLGVAMELSSIGLEQDRAKGLPISIGIFSNFTQDHLDYHSDMDSYFSAKTAMFSEFPIQYGIFNLDDPKIFDWVQKLKNAYFKIIGYSLNEDLLDSVNFCFKKFLASNINLKSSEICFVLKYSEAEEPVTIPTLGYFNVGNALASLAAIDAMGLNVNQACTDFEKITPIPGRLELVLNDPSKVKVWVDFAHTPDGLKKVLSAIKSVCGGKLIVVFGCGGDRDKKKRPLMLSAAKYGADKVIITQDNSRSESFDSILTDMLVNDDIEKYEIISCRKDAIKQAIDLANINDHVLIAGRGHEQVHDLGNTKLNYTDKDVVKQHMKPYSM